MTDVKKCKDDDPPSCPGGNDDPQKQIISKVDDEKRTHQ
jgi:hypothetical protein